MDKTPTVCVLSICLSIPELPWPSGLRKKKKNPLHVSPWCHYVNREVLFYYFIEIHVYRRSVRDKWRVLTKRRISYPCAVTEEERQWMKEPIKCHNRVNRQLRPYLQYKLWLIKFAEDKWKGEFCRPSWSLWIRCEEEGRARPRVREGEVWFMGRDSYNHSQVLYKLIVCSCASRRNKSQDNNVDVNLLR